MPEKCAICKEQCLPWAYSKEYQNYICKYCWSKGPVPCPALNSTLLACNIGEILMAYFKDNKVDMDNNKWHSLSLDFKYNKIDHNLSITNLTVAMKEK